ncbi:MAG: hypothetical protein K9L22_06505 [Methylococcaceae bacterium]|nr:hypothetical protein [Methylococcaceae bacterium]
MFQPPQKKILICSGFHRSATSVTARYLDNAGLAMGVHLMGGGISNVAGHYEDWPVVQLHDRLLTQCATSWQYHGEVNLSKNSNADMVRYIQLRDQCSGNWGFKDPRALLFLNAWQQVLGQRGSYLLLIRHWSSAIESLLHRHSRNLAHGLKQNPIDLKFWQQPDLAARMWLAYNQRLLMFVEQNPEQCLVLTQRSLFADNPLITTLNTRFGLDLDVSTTRPFEPSLLRDHASSRVASMLSDGLRQQLDDLWENLLKVAYFRVENEAPIWLKDESTPINIAVKDKLAEARRKLPVQKQLLHGISINDFIAQLDSAESEETLIKLFVKVRANGQWQNVQDAENLMQWVAQHHKTTAKVNLELALWLKARQLWTQAIEALQWTMSLGMAFPYLYLHLGQCYEAINELPLAAYFFDTAIERNKNNPDFWIAKGRFLRNRGKLEQSVSYFAQGAELAPDNPGRVLPYCEVLEQVERVDEALTLAQSLFDKTPDHSAVQAMLVRLTLLDDVEKGQALYQTLTEERLAKEDRFAWLAEILQDIGLGVAESDFVLRVDRL